MSLLLDALKTAEGQAQRNRPDETVRRDATLTDDQILTLAEDHVAATPAQAAPAASGRFRHNPAAFPPIADTMRARVPSAAATRRWVRPVGIAALVLAAAAMLWVIFRPDAVVPALVPPVQGAHVATTASVATESLAVEPAVPAAAALAGASGVADATDAVPEEAGSVRAASSAVADQGPAGDPVIASRVERTPVVITGRPSPLAAAHAALRAGDLQGAESLYRQTLATERDQPDAHLGMALIEQSRGARQAALAQYRAVLALRPGDPQAWAGLADLTSDGELHGMESRLRSLVATRPDPALHFALGNILARQSRWSEAQESYFAAATGAPQNADYAFNLAVALDQIGKGSVAATHYARALALAGDSRAVQFDAAAARARLQQLEAATP